MVRRCELNERLQQTVEFKQNRIDELMEDMELLRKRNSQVTI